MLINTTQLNKLFYNDKECIAIYANNKKIWEAFNPKFNYFVVKVTKDDIISVSPRRTGTTYDKTTDWGDGTQSVAGVDSHFKTYTTAGTYTIKTQGTLSVPSIISGSPNKNNNDKCLIGCSNLSNDNTGFYEYFKGMTNLEYCSSIPEGAYEFTSMFEDCVNLVTFGGFRGKFTCNDIQTGNLHSYNKMFKNCKKLNIPINIQMNCTGKYTEMFYGCSSLSYTPTFYYTDDLNLIGNSYKNFESMFEDCESLINPPEIPDISSLNKCIPYVQKMFKNCKKLKTAPPIPRHVGYSSKCIDCSEMFYGCESLTVAAEMLKDQISYCPSTFENCINLTILPAANKTLLTDEFMGYACYRNCTKLIDPPYSSIPSTWK